MYDKPVTCLPSFCFQSSDLPSAERFATWAALLSGYDMSLPHGAPAANFAAEAEAWQVGQVRVTAGLMSSCDSHRSASRRRRDGDDSYAVHVLASGSWRGRFDGRDVSVGMDEPILVDHAYETHASASSCRYLSLDLPRDLLDEALRPAGKRHGTVLRGMTGRLLTEHLRTLGRVLPGMTAAEASLVGSATRDLLAACLTSDRDRIEQVRPQIDGARLRCVRRHIEGGLWGADLSPSSIAAALGLSRSTLYRMFEPVGGVAAYVASRRLMEARRVLSNSTDRRRVSEVSAGLGFNGVAQFSRAFRRRFGDSPSDARSEAARPAPAPAAATDIARSYHAWIGQAGWTAS